MTVANRPVICEECQQPTGDFREGDGRQWGTCAVCCSLDHDPERGEPTRTRAMLECLDCGAFNWHATTVNAVLDWDPDDTGVHFESGIDETITVSCADCGATCPHEVHWA